MHGAAVLLWLQSEGRSIDSGFKPTLMSFHFIDTIYLVPRLAWNVVPVQVYV